VTARVRRDGDTISFRLRLTPKGGRNAIEGWSLSADGTQYLKARVSRAPQNGEANAALIALLSKTLGVAGSRIRIVGGEAARLKTIQISRAPLSVAARLEAMEIAK
jgi:uncharacterized protein YggU (UPF0235/DUF167 family)